MSTSYGAPHIQLSAPLHAWLGATISRQNSAAAGAVLGALIGDAAGGVLEFLDRKPSPQESQDALLRMPGGGVFRLAPGQFTDDGELTTALLKALSCSGRQWDADQTAHAYCAWAASHPFDMGMTTVAALGRKRPESPVGLALQVAERAASKSPESKANGALMRISPLAVAGRHWAEAALAEAARADCRLTHPNMACQHANAAYVLAMRTLLLHPGKVKEALAAARQYLDSQPEAIEVRSWFEDAIRGHLTPVHPMAGFVRHGFTRAFHHLAINSGFESGIVSVLSEGGDTDTNACIVGGMLGALHGVHGLPQVSLTALLDCDTEQGQPRPDDFTIKAVKKHLPVLLQQE